MVSEMALTLGRFASVARKALASLTMLLVAVVVMAGLAFPSAARAQGLNGSQVSYAQNYPNIGSTFFNQGPVTVGSGVEFPIAQSGLISIDVTDTQIIVTGTGSGTFTSGVAYNGPILTFNTTITSAYVSASSTMGHNIVSHTSNTVRIDMQGVSVGSGQVLIIDVNGAPPLPTVTSVSPASGSASGGTAVTITGTNFTGASAVTFGGVAATGFTVNSATQITATAPAGTGTVDIRVTTGGGTSATSAADQFTYLQALGSSVSFAPDPLIVGGASGVMTITLTNPNATNSPAVNFLLTTDAFTQRNPASPGGTCTVGGASIPTTTTVQFANVVAPPGSCTITLPYRGLAAGTGTFSVAAFTPSGYPQTASASTSITVLPAAPTVTALSPASGPLGGGTAVTLTGTNFTGATAVSFGASPAASFSLDSATQITATAPAGSAGAVDVTVTTPSGTSATAGAGNDYTYVAAPSAPVTITPANGALTSDNTPTYTGTAGTGLTVNVIVDGTTIGTTTADGAGNWSYTPAVALADGAHTIRAAATNAGGTSPNSNINTFTVDTTAPAAPVVTTPANGATINFSTPAYIGTAEPNTTVTIVVDGSAIGTTGANASGAWGFSQVVPLAPGSHTVRATATDAAGNTSPSSSTVTFSYVPITLPGGALAGGQVGTSYSASVTASGGTAPYTYAVTGGALPAGITLSTGGALSGTPTASGTYNFQVTATDSTSLTATGAYSITVNAPPAPDADPETATVTSTGGAQGIDLSGSVSGAASIQIVTPPAHGAASVSGFTVNYTPEPGYYGPVTFTYSAVGYPDGSTPGAVSAPATVTITIPDPVLALPGGALPGATVAASYSHAFSASGGTAPYTYLVTAGALPAGLTLSTGGVLSGTPTAGGPFSFSVTATDSSTGTGPFSVTGAYTLAVAAPTITLSPASLPNATVAVAGYSQTITASGGVGGYSYALTAGALPAGMSLSTGGVLSGTPTAGGSFNFTVTATDQSTGAGPYTGSRAYSLTVDAAAIVVTPTTVPAATRGFAYSQAFSATGGVGSYTWAVSAGALPAGLTLSTAGALSGTPTATGSFNFTVRATDQATGSGPYSGTVSVTLVVNAAAITVTPTTLPSVMAGVAYDRSLSATGGAGTYTYAVTSGALPSGMTLSTAGRISGTSYAVGQANFTVTATDSFGNSGSVPLRIVVTARPDPSQDPDVRGLDAAQAEATRRLASAQIDNFSRRLEQLHAGGGDQPMSMGLSLNSGVTDLAGVGQDADLRSRLGGGRMFDQARSDPDRAELNNRLWSASADGRNAAGSMGGGSALGYGSGSVSGGQPTLNAAPMQSDGSSSGGARFWTGGAITIGERDADSGQAEFSVRSTGISLGVDFAVSPNFDLGFGGGFGEESADIGSADSSADSKQFSGVVYGSFRPQQGVFIDAMLGYGSLEFDLQRRVTADGSLVMGEREGTAMFGSIGLGYDRPVSIGRMTAYGRVESLDATLDAYTETGSALWALSYAERDVESLQGVLGARYVWSHEERDSTWTPSFRFEYRHEFADGGIQNLQYADWLSGPTYQIRSTGWDRSEINLGLGLNVTTADGWKIASELGARLATNQTAGTLRLTLSKSF